ncbi:MAG: gliding motility-associated C-terminal domain-containing protein [Bacteroidales bacterium]|nr:gliding motility-associated C-terminal domain-containing protein [Bacteroidales bacterium]MDX9797245.1 gliding motility-associated C-terminal domain-containing protein [Bacteroidales bacterium]
MKKRFENFEQTPPADAWGNIQSNLPKPKFNWLAFSTIVGAAVLVGLTAVLFIPSNNENTVQNQIINKEESPLAKTEKNDMGVILSEENLPLKDSKPIINNVEENLQAENVSSSNQTLAVPIINKISTPIETTTKIKETTKTTPKTLKTDIASTNTQQTTETTESEFELVNEIDNKASIGEDTNLIFRLFIPNAFTPMQNTNNVFKPAFETLKTYEMHIYNRKGLLVFTSKDINNGWNGLYKGKLCEQGAYAYIIIFKNLEGKEYKQSGTVYLIR